MTTRLAIALETTAKRTFASAVDWPGLARSGRTEAAAIEALIACVERYGKVARAAGIAFQATGGTSVEVVEAAEGNGSTDFGVPGRVTDWDRRPTTADDADRLARLVQGAWTQFMATAAAAPAALRKGPRGGGRDTANIIAHVLGAEHAYARELGIRVAAPVAADAASVRILREAMLDVVGRPSDGTPIAGRRWTARYAAHRIAWHAIDHTWEIEDRAEPTPAR